MVRFTFVCLAGLLLGNSFCSGQEEDVKAQVVPMERSVGINKWVVVEGRNVRLRKALSSMADKVAQDFAKLLGETKQEDGTRSVVVNMYEVGKGNFSMGVRPYVQPLEGGKILIGMRLDARGKIDREVFEKGLIEIFVYERSLRGKNMIGENDQIQVPHWLVTGLSAALEWKDDKVDRRIYGLLRDRPDLFPVDELFETGGRELQQLDETKKAFYRASSCALVMSMLQQNGGKESMRKMLSEVALFEGESAELLRKYFPGMNTGAKGLQKVWNLQVADMAAPKLSETLDIKETEKRLSEVLFFSQFDVNGVGRQVPLTEFGVLKDLDLQQRINSLAATRADLVQLSYRSFPSYRPFLMEYSLLTADLIKGKDEGMADRLANMEEQRILMLTSYERTRDYLDWYQISQAHEVKGDFSGYMRLKERLAMEREERKDPVIDTYLDQVQGVFGGKSTEEK